MIPSLEKKGIFERVKATGIADLSVACIALILAALRSTIRGSFHVAEIRLYFLGLV